MTCRDSRISITIVSFINIVYIYEFNVKEIYNNFVLVSRA